MSISKAPGGLTAGDSVLPFFGHQQYQIHLPKKLIKHIADFVSEIK